MIILGIESSCDDTSIGIVENGNNIISNITFSQITHKEFFGVVPEIASREHLNIIDKVTRIALKKANLTIKNIDAFAVTLYPGLIGSLIVGVNYAKGLALRFNKPLIGVNHLTGHIYTAFFYNKIDFPFLSLLISGGHTVLAIFKDFYNYEIIGKTIDDACGEAFDKIAKHFKLGYPGGPIIDKLSKFGKPDFYKFPLPLSDFARYGYNFSFSGLKTAVMYHRRKYINKDQNDNKNEESKSENSKDQNNTLNNNSLENINKNLNPEDLLDKNPREYLKIKNLELKKENILDSSENLENILASFQETIAKILLLKTVKAALEFNIKNVIIAGGSSANSAIRSKFLKEDKIKSIFPPLNLCMDNGAMIAGIAYHIYKKFPQKYSLNNNLNLLKMNPFSRIQELKRGNI